MVFARNNYDAVRDWDADHTAVNFADVKFNNPGKSFSQEFRFTSDMIGNKEYTVGLFILDSEYGERGGFPDDGAIRIGNHVTPVWGAFSASLQSNIATLQAVLANPNATPAMKAGATATLAELGPKAAGVGGVTALVLEGDYISQDMTWYDQTSAIFGRMTVHLSDTLRYTLGARYSSELKEARQNRDQSKPIGKRCAAIIHLIKHRLHQKDGNKQNTIGKDEAYD